MKWLSQDEVLTEVLIFAMCAEQAQIHSLAINTDMFNTIKEQKSKKYSHWGNNGREFKGDFIEKKTQSIEVSVGVGNRMN